MLGVLMIGGMIAGGLKAYSRSVEYDEKLNDLKQKREDLKDTFNDSIANVAADLADANRKLEANIQDTTTMRDASARTSGKQLLNQQVLAEMDMADLQVQAADQMGSAMQNLAMSGTRRMVATRESNVKSENGKYDVVTGAGQVGRVLNPQVFKTQGAVDSAISKARTQANISFFNNADQARMSYLNSTLNIKAYQREIEMNGSLELDAEGKVQFDENGKVKGTGKAARTINSYKLSYDQQYNELTRDIDYMNGEGNTMLGLSMFGDFLSGLFGGLSMGF